jgi:UDP-N-acetylglucosamine--dolichyl-phosphate N-acetylglucosaminephosphotransferase
MKLSYIIIIEAIVAFLITLYFTIKYIKIAKLKDLTGIDVHKVNKPKIPEMGGFAIIFGFIFGTAILYPFLSAPYNFFILTATLVVIISAFIGVFDDLINLSPMKKIILLLIASIPLIITRLGDYSITIPIYGKVYLGIYFSLIIVPLFVTIFANATNFLAGYNGLEAGLGIITIFYYILIGLITKNYIIVFILAPFLFALIAFYLFNKYPAKIFPGDVTTLSIGAIIASTAIISNTEFTAIFLCLLYLINFGLYCIYTFIYYPITKMKESKISSVDKNGILERQYFSNKKIQWQKMYFLFEHWFYPCTEKKLVAIFFTIQFVLNGIVLLFYVL